MLIGPDENLCRHCGFVIKYFRLNVFNRRAPWAHLDKAHWTDKPHKAQPLRM